MSILYIDDDPEDIEIFYEAVKTVDPSINYSSATSGKQAFEILNSSDVFPSHIVLDINIPGMDGKIILEELRKEKKFDAINVIIYSTDSSPKDIEQIESLGSTFIRKANSFNELCHLIRMMADGTIGAKKGIGA
ncbi:MAG: response regulator [Cyclobacteriaceae bacterium]